jgi:DNA-binding response OmpR family regulator
MTMHRLRRKLGNTPETGEVLEAIAGVGFILKEVREASLTG